MRARGAWDCIRISDKGQVVRRPGSRQCLPRPDGTCIRLAVRPTFTSRRAPTADCRWWVPRSSHFTSTTDERKLLPRLPHHMGCSPRNGVHVCVWVRWMGGVENKAGDNAAVKASEVVCVKLSVEVGCKLFFLSWGCGDCWPPSFFFLMLQ